MRVGSTSGRAAAALIGVIVAYGVLVLTHRGEFWPFSVFPMYSRGLEAWSRPMIREIPGSAGPEVWQVTGLDDLPGEVFSLFTEGVRRRELRRIFDTTETWGKQEILSLRSLVGEDSIRGRHLLVVNVRGRMTRDEGVSVECTPLAILTEAGTRVNPAFGE